ncbi:MAG: T9SS type A sorting domain-containing protein [Saprospiraceae bacterium]|nr:T9SS type A sorting domain-containing protein [Saprospiraceae bacterium]
MNLTSAGTLEMYGDGTARLTASWINASGTAGWDGTIWFHHRRSYDGWLAAGGKANTDAGGDPTGWSYFELDASRSELEGTSGNAGINLRVQQSQNYSKHGLQVGSGANTKTAGAGGWCAIATLNDQGQYTSRGYISFMSACTATDLIKNAGKSLPSVVGHILSNGLIIRPMMPSAILHQGTHSVSVTDGNGQVHNHVFTLAAPTGCTLLWENHCREANVAVGATASQISTGRAVQPTVPWMAIRMAISRMVRSPVRWPAGRITGQQIWVRITRSNPSGSGHGRTVETAAWIRSTSLSLPIRSRIWHRIKCWLRPESGRSAMKGRWMKPGACRPIWCGQYIKVQLEAEGRLMMAEVEALVCQKDRLDPVPGSPLWPGAPAFTNGDHTANVDDLSVWPNPTSDELNIYINQSRVAPTAVTIMSMTGQQVYRNDLSGAKEHQLRIPVGSWLGGMYAITVSGPDGLRTQWVQVSR